MEREVMEFDVLIVGAGPAGLSTAIRLAQHGNTMDQPPSICVVEKGAEIGAHILSGAVIETRALDELIPDWLEKNAPLETLVCEEKFMFLTEKNGFSIPPFLLPPPMHNRGNYIISLGNLCRWLGAQAESLGVEIYPGFAASQIVYHESGSEAGAVRGIVTGDMGIGRDGKKTTQYQPGIELYARYTVFAEGCRGHLGKELMRHFDLRADCAPQTYGIGLKELWEVDPAQHRPGLVLHSAGWPLDDKTYGGSFLYHLEGQQVAIGFVVGLDYDNPYLSPFEEFQRFKTHPKIRPYLQGGRRVAYGARALNEGGIQSLPRLAFPGGVLVGCEAGTLNMPKIKGSHTAMKSGMLAADALATALIAGRKGDVLVDFQPSFQASWAGRELHRARNIRPAFKWGLWKAALYTGIDQIVLRGHAPWTLHHENLADHERLKPANQSVPIEYPHPDGVVSFDRNSSVFLSGTNHEENQPVHLTLENPDIPILVNLAEYDAPEQRYCPAGVYEITQTDEGPKLQINAQNCVHCKSCDIKDPTQNIHWVTPQGGEGPVYPNM